MGRIDDVLAEARQALTRMSPHEVLAAYEAGVALVVDTRTETQRAEQGELPGAVVIARTVLEWRLDPTSPWRIPEAEPGKYAVVVVVCAQGYSSSIAAAALQRLGIDGATDMIGGFDAWRAAGLPVGAGPADVRR